MQRGSKRHLETGENAVAGDEEDVERALPRRHGAPVAVVGLGHRRRRHGHLGVAHAAFHLPAHLLRLRRSLAKTLRTIRGSSADKWRRVPGKSPEKSPKIAGRAGTNRGEAGALAAGGRAHHGTGARGGRGDRDAKLLEGASGREVEGEGAMGSGGEGEVRGEERKYKFRGNIPSRTKGERAFL